MRAMVHVLVSFYITECDFETEPDMEVSGLQEPLVCSPLEMVLTLGLQFPVLPGGICTMRSPTKIPSVPLRSHYSL